MKTLAGLLLALMLVSAYAAPVFASSGTSVSGPQTSAPADEDKDKDKDKKSD